MEYIETPTSMAYSSNKLSVAVYPICMEFKTTEDGPVHKGAITFISDDKIHDHQQVKAFENRMFEMVRNDFGLNMTHWQRWLDGCGAQFKSKFVNSNLLKAKESFQLENASLSYFEAHEGKNASDTIGSIVKCTFLKGIANENQGIGKASDVELVARNTKTETKKFDLFVVEEFLSMERIEEHDRPNFEIKGITKVHQLYVRDAGLIAEECSCMDCSHDRLCNECVNKEFYQIDEESDDSEDEDADEIIDDDDLGCSDDDEEDISDDEDVHDSCSNFGPGDIVWGKYGRKFFPAKIVSFNQLPEKVQAGLGKSRKADSVIVQWYGEDNYSWVKTRNIDELSNAIPRGHP